MMLTIKPERLVENKANVFKIIIISFCIIIFSGWTIAAEELAGDASNLMSDEEEIEYGRLVDEGIRRHFSVCTTNELVQRVNEVGSKLVTVSDRQDIPYVFTILESDTLNAFSGPAGYVYVTTGILEFVTSTDELAGVVAHELAHVALRHVAKIMRDAGIGHQIDPHDQEGIGEMISLFTYHTFEYEAEADILGVTYAFKAGYNPYGLPDFMEKVLLDSLRGGIHRPFSFLLIYKLKWPERLEAIREHIVILQQESN